MYEQPDVSHFNSGNSINNINTNLYLTNLYRHIT